MKFNNIAVIPFRMGVGKFLNIYFAYTPDSYAHSNNYPEFKELFSKFISSNHLNNAGDIPRLWSFILNCNQVIAEGVDGAFAEVGVWRGNTAAVLAHYARQEDRHLYLFDTFTGFDQKDLKNIDSEKKVIFNDTSLEMVRRTVGNDSHCTYEVGYFPDTVRSVHQDASYAVVSLDADLYEPTRAGLEFFYPRMKKGAICFLHDYSSGRWEGSKKAIDEFCRVTGEFIILMPDKSGSAFFRKSQ